MQATSIHSVRENSDEVAHAAEELATIVEAFVLRDHKSSHVHLKVA